MIFDLTIIGGGPAGVAAGVYAARKKLKTVFITKDFFGQSSASLGVENWIGTPIISGMDLSKSLETHLKTYAKDVIDIVEGEWVENIKKINKEGIEIFEIKTNKNSFFSKAILITSGSSRKKLEAIGSDKFEHKGLTYCATCDGPTFVDSAVVVVGGGNSAFESASQLLSYCTKVYLINRSEVLRADPITVQKVLANPKFTLINNAVTKEVLGDKMVNGLIYTDTKSGKENKLEVEGIFVEIGHNPNTTFAKDVVELDKYGKVIVDPKNQKTNTKGIWAAGDCTNGLYHQNNIAVGDAVKALEDIYYFLNI